MYFFIVQQGDFCQKLFNLYIREYTWHYNVTYKILQP